EVRSDCAQAGQSSGHLQEEEQRPQEEDEQLRREGSQDLRAEAEIAPRPTLTLPPGRAPRHGAARPAFAPSLSRARSGASATGSGTRACGAGARAPRSAPSPPA